MEAEAGIEPANVGFANRCLTTWLLRPDFESWGREGIPPQGGILVVAMPVLVNSAIGELLSRKRWQERYLPKENFPPMQHPSVQTAPQPRAKLNR